MSGHLLVVEQTAPRRHVAQVIGTPLWSAGPSPEYAVGALVLTFGDRLGLRPLERDEPYVRAIREAGRCAVPILEST